MSISTIFVRTFAFQTTSQRNGIAIYSFPFCMGLSSYGYFICLSYFVHIMHLVETDACLPPACHLPATCLPVGRVGRVGRAGGEFACDVSSPQFVYRYTCSFHSSRFIFFPLGYRTVHEIDLSAFSAGFTPINHFTSPVSAFNFPPESRVSVTSISEWADRGN